jgi:DNA-binding NarL/FixJ family response regulator
VVRLTAAASALREAAGLPARHGARLDRFLDAARDRLGQPAIDRLWAQGRILNTDAAVTLALNGAGLNAPPLNGEPRDVPVPASTGPAGTVPAGTVSAGTVPAGTVPSGTGLAALTPREREVVALIARGYSNKAIADELVISPSTAARHVANIMGKLGFTSRTQVAWWAADQPSGPAPES